MNIKECDLSFFDPIDLDHAKQIILTPEDETVESRWRKETDWTIKVMDSLFEIDENSVVLDWGCGIGRLSKAMIDQFNCRVVGVDITAKMSEYSLEYVNSDRFSILDYPTSLQGLGKNVFTHCVSVWVFQHSNRLNIEIPMIYQSLKNNGKLFLTESDKKTIPSKDGFFDDGVPTRSVLEKLFDIETGGRIPQKHTTSRIRSMSWWAILTRKQNWNH